MKFDDKVFVLNIKTLIGAGLPLLLGIVCAVMFKSVSILIAFGLVGIIYPDIIYLKIRVKEGESGEEIYKKICRKNRLTIKENETPEELYSRLKKKGRIQAAIFLLIGVPIIMMSLTKIISLLIE